MANRSVTVRLDPLARAATYGVVGSLMECLFTSARLSRNARALRLSGPATRWMAPIYALALPLFEPAHDRVRHRPAWLRAALYASGILAAEGATGWALRRATGRCPWDYSGRTRWHVAGLVRLDYAPFWALTGLGAERLHDAMAGAAGQRTQSGRRHDAAGKPEAETRAKPRQARSCDTNPKPRLPHALQSAAVGR